MRCFILHLTLNVILEHDYLHSVIDYFNVIYMLNVSFGRSVFTGANAGARLALVTATAGEPELHRLDPVG